RGQDSDSACAGSEENARGKAIAGRLIESAEMWNRFPPRMRRAINGALEEAGGRGHEQALPEHLLLRIAADRESAAAFIFEQCGIAPAALVDELSRNAAPGGAAQQRAGRFASSAM